MKKNLPIIILIFISLPFFAKAQNVLDQAVNFNVESSYDLSNRTELSATLIKISLRAYWYVDSAWWEGLGKDSQETTKASLDSFIIEFEGHIYPTLTGTFGSEWNPGIDKDTRITVLIHPMKKESGGYTDSADEYPKAQIPQSNEREMIYLNSQYINTTNAKVFLGHELVHLITINQKDKTYNVSEDVWLNEGRAEYSATLLGYDQEYEGSNLQRRVKDFLDRPSDSLTEWRETPADYGVANLFMQYLVDHYGIGILVDSLKLKKTGIESLNTILARQGFKEDFPQVFTNWTIAILINDCQVSEKYCYYNQNLKNFRVTPLVNYLPLVGDSTLFVTNTTKDWAGNWHKFLGGRGTLKLEFGGSPGVYFKVPYIVEDSDGNIFVKNLALDQNQKGEVELESFGNKNLSLTIIPIAENKISQFSNPEPSRTFSWLASTKAEKEAEENPITLPPLQKPISQMSREEILARITQIQSLILQLQAQLTNLIGSPVTCQEITQDLYFGMQNNSQVRCLQEFLASQGSEIYSEGLVTGNFYTLTEKAVIRFQEKYASEILAPLSLSRGTGYVGSATRVKINELLTP